MSLEEEFNLHCSLCSINGNNNNIQFNDLSCGHSLCFSCLFHTLYNEIYLSIDSFMNNDKITINCPICGIGKSLITKDKLTNLLISNINNNIQSSVCDNKENKIGLYLKNNDFLYKKDRNINYICSCREKNKDKYIKSIGNITTENISTKKPKSSPNLCLIHKISLDYYCKTCNNFLCRKCFSNNNSHKNHLIENIQIYIKDSIENIKQNKEKLISEIDVKSFIEKNSNNQLSMDTLKNAINKIEKAIKHFIQIKNKYIEKYNYLKEKQDKLSKIISLSNDYVSKEIKDIINSKKNKNTKEFNNLYTLKFLCELKDNLNKKNKLTLCKKSNNTNILSQLDTSEKTLNEENHSYLYQKSSDFDNFYCDFECNIEKDDIFIPDIYNEINNKNKSNKKNGNNNKDIICNRNDNNNGDELFIDNDNKNFSNIKSLEKSKQIEKYGKSSKKENKVFSENIDINYIDFGEDISKIEEKDYLTDFNYDFNETMDKNMFSNNNMSIKYSCIYTICTKTIGKDTEMPYTFNYSKLIIPQQKGNNLIYDFKGSKLSLLTDNKDKDMNIYLNEEILIDDKNKRKIKIIIYNNKSGNYDGEQINVNGYVNGINSNNNKFIEYVINGHEDIITSLERISENEFVSSSLDNTIKLWRRYNMKYKCVQTIKEHRKSVNSLLYFSNKILISCSDDKTIKIWKFDSKKGFYLIQTIAEHKNTVKSLLKLDNFIFVSSDTDNTIKFWKII